MIDLRKSHEISEVSNPFEHKVHLNIWQKLQLIFMSLTVFPIRVICLCVTTFLLCSVCAIGTVGLPLVPVKPIDGWRRKLKPVVRALLRFVFFCCGYHKIEVRGRENLNPDYDPDIMVAFPHTTFFDTVVIFASNDFPTGVSRIENIQIPILGYVTKFFTPICVVRSKHTSRRDTINEIKKRVQSRIKFRSYNENESQAENDEERSSVPMNWPPLCLFPEGTTSNGKSLIIFKKGAFIPGVPVQPIFVQHINSMNTTSWTFIGEGVWSIMWKTMCQLSTTAVITILPLYEPSLEEVQNHKLYATNVRAFLSSQVGIPVSDFNYFDASFVVYLSKLTLQPLSPLINLNRIIDNVKKESKFNFSEFVESLANREPPSDEPFTSLEHFDKLLNDYAPFKELLELLTKSKIQQLYEAVVLPEGKMVNMQQFLVWFSLSCEPKRTWAIVEVAFKVYSSDGSSKLTKAQLTEVLVTLFQSNGAELDLMLDYFSNHSSEISIDDLVKLAQETTEAKSVIKCQCSEILKRFYVPKEILLGDWNDIDRRAWTNCKGCSHDEKCGRDGSCKKFAKLRKICLETHVLKVEDDHQKKD